MLLFVQLPLNKHGVGRNLLDRQVNHRLLIDDVPGPAIAVGQPPIQQVSTGRQGPMAGVVHDGKQLQG